MHQAGSWCVQKKTRFCTKKPPNLYQFLPENYPPHFSTKKPPIYTNSYPKAPCPNFFLTRIRPICTLLPPPPRHPIFFTGKNPNLHQFLPPARAPWFTQKSPNLLQFLPTPPPPICTIFLPKKKPDKGCGVFLGTRNAGVLVRFAEFFGNIFGWGFF